jgi:hypothetical protein
MHVLLVIVGGVMLLGLFLLFGWLWRGDPSGVIIAAKAFIPAWLVVAVVNLWVGVHHAGYSVREELPILLAVFAVPVAMAVAVLWQLSRN